MKKNLTDAIGNTPIVEIFKDKPGTIYAKLEYLNPGGSIKDRSALYMIESAEKSGALKPGMTLIDASSGNHGVALAMIGAARGYDVIICSTKKHSPEKLNTIKAYGGKVLAFDSTPTIEDPNSYHSQAVALHKNTPNSYMPNQYYSLVNREAHYHSLGKEIWEQTNGKITHYIAAAGTGGTVSGAGRYLKEKNPDIKVIAVDAANSYRSTKGNPQPYKLEGLGVDSDSIVLDYNVIDEFITVTDDEGIDMMKNLAQNHGFLVGPSSGAVGHAAYTYAQNLRPDDIAVIIFGDSGRAYLSKGFYE